MQTYRHTAHHTISGLAWAGYHLISHRLPSARESMWSGAVNEPYIKNIFGKKNSSSCSLKFSFSVVCMYHFKSVPFFYCPFLFISFLFKGSITRHDIDSPPTSERVVSIYKYEDIFMPSAAYQTFSSPFCLLLIVALTFYLLMGTP